MNKKKRLEAFRLLIKLRKRLKSPKDLALIEGVIDMILPKKYR